MKRWLGLSGYAAGGLGWLPVAVVAGLLSAPHALAQSGELRSLLDRMERLERDIGTLNRQLSRGAIDMDLRAMASASSASSSMSARAAASAKAPPDPPSRAWMSV